MEMREKGESVPFLNDMPKVLPGARWLLDAWEALNASRQYVNGYPSAIIPSEMWAYAQLIGIADRPEMRRVFLDIITALDAHFLPKEKERIDKLRKRRSAAGPASGKTPRPRRR